MKSLREEIKSDIYMIAGGKDNVGIRWVDCDKITDSIISKIEKRIDSKIHETLELKRGNWYDAKVEGMKEIKEMLRK